MSDIVTTNDVRLKLAAEWELGGPITFSKTGHNPACEGNCGEHTSEAGLNEATTLTRLQWMLSLIAFSLIKTVTKNQIIAVC